MGSDGGVATGGTTGRLRALVRGRTDTRVRATYRVLLAVPVFWILAGGVIAGNLRALVPAIPTGEARLAGLAGSVLHAGAILVLLVGWARYLDRRPLSAYGVSASGPWLGRLLVGTGAVVAVAGLWNAAAAGLGWVSVEVAASAPQGSLPVALALYVAALGLHVWAQQLVFFRIVLGNAAEGLHSRGLAPRRAALAGIAVAVPLFLAIHQLGSGLRILDLTVVGLIYGLSYVHTGDLALGIGFHLGAFLLGPLFVPAADTATALSVFGVTRTMPDAVATLNAYGFPKLLVAYGLVLGLIVYERGEIPVVADIARWDG